MTKNILFVTLVTALSSFFAVAQANIQYDLERYSDQKRFFPIQYSGFSMFYDCYYKSPVFIEAIIEEDKGNIRRKDDFRLDNRLPKECQQSSTKPYGSKQGIQYDRGHLLGFNMFDDNPLAASESFIFVNIVPQASVFNRSGWKWTEEITECLREDYEQIKVVVGVFYDSKSNDHFLRSHNVRTPDYIWKIIETPEGSITWVFPNTNDVKESNVNNYLSSVATVESMIRLPLNVSFKMFDQRKIPKSTKHCDLS